MNKKLKFCISICTTIQMFGVSNYYFFKESNTFIQEGCVKLIKGESADLYFEKSFLF